MARGAIDRRSCGIAVRCAVVKDHLQICSGKRVLLRAATAVSVLGLAEPCCAGLLDSLRAIDINDYAVGIGVSTTENIYVDAGDSQTIYPYLTKLVPSALDDGVTFGMRPSRRSAAAYMSSISSKSSARPRAIACWRRFES